MDFVEKDICIKCNKGGKVLVCSDSGCPISVHHECMGCPPRFDGSGKFYCPYCSYRKAIAEAYQARDDVMLKNKALSAFLGEEFIDGNKDLLTSTRSSPSESELSSKKENNDYLGRGVRDDLCDLRLVVVRHQTHSGPCQEGTANQFELVEVSRRVESPDQGQLADHLVVTTFGNQQDGSLNEAPLDQDLEVENASLATTKIKANEAGIAGKTEMQEKPHETLKISTKEVPEPQVYSRELVNHLVGTTFEEQQDGSLNNSPVDEEIEVENASQATTRIKENEDGGTPGKQEMKEKLHGTLESLVNEEPSPQVSEEQPADHLVGTTSEDHRDSSSNDSHVGKEMGVGNISHATTKMKVDGGEAAEKQEMQEKLHQTPESFTNYEPASQVCSKAEVGFESGDSISSYAEDVHIQHKSKKRKNRNYRSRVDSPRRSSLRRNAAQTGEIDESRKLRQTKRPNGFSLKKSFLNARRTRLPWRDEEEEMLKAGVRKFSATINKNLPWRKILEYGHNVFDSTRTPADLKDKWRNILAKEA